jgi:hypothetical protein
MSNWDASLQTAREEGKVHSMYPPDFKLPMVAPHDLGPVRRRLMLGRPNRRGRTMSKAPSAIRQATWREAFRKRWGGRWKWP